MPLRKVDTSRVVGLSTEESPTSQSRTENPRIRNLEVDQGGVAKTRDGYQRLSTEALTDASIELRGAPFNSTLFHEYRDAAVIQDRSDYATSSAEWMISGILEFTPSGPEGGDPVLGDVAESLLQSNEYGVISHGRLTAGNRGTSLPLTLYLDYTASNWTWTLRCLTTAPAAQTMTVTDTALTAGQIGLKRYFEIKFDTDTITLRITDGAGNSIGTDTDSSFTGGLYEANNGDPWVIGTTPGNDGQPPANSAITASGTDQGWLAARVAEIRILGGDGSGSGQYSWDTDNSVDSREYRPDEYANAAFEGYWPCNDGVRYQLRDVLDSRTNVEYSREGGARANPNHATLLHTPLEWISGVNDIEVDVSENADIATNYTGVDLVNASGVYFNGLEGMILWRAVDQYSAASVSGTANPLVAVYSQAPAAGVGWTVEFMFTPLLAPGQSTYPECVLYASSDESNGSSTDNTINPIIIGVDSSGQFYVTFHYAATTVTMPITTAGRLAADFAGEQVTLFAVRNNNALDFYAVGENKSGNATQQTISSVPTIPIASQPQNGPFVMIGRKVDAFVAGADDPASYTTPAARMVWHEFRLWSRPFAVNVLEARANSPIPTSQVDLSLRLIADEGPDEPIRNLAAPDTYTLGNQFNSWTAVSVPEDSESRVFPRKDDGPRFSKGLVKTFMPVKAHGIVDFRRNIGETVARELIIASGSNLYSFNLADNTLTWLSGGMEKTDRQASMVVFENRVYIANGGRPMVWDGSRIRRAGIDAPQSRLVVTTGTAGSIDNNGTGFYRMAYRYGNSADGVYSNLSPATELDFTGGSNDGSISAVSNIELPTDPQVDVIEFWFTVTGDDTQMYRLQGDDGLLTNFFAGSVTFGTAITALTTAQMDAALPAPLQLSDFSVNPAIVGDSYQFTPPPRSTVIGLLGTRLIYALTDEPETCVFSRIDGGIQPEHINMTPGFSARLKIPVDTGDQITAMRQYRDSLIVYLRDARAELAPSGLEPTTTGFETPIEINILDHEIGCVSPYGVSSAAHTHITLAESDLWTLSISEVHNLSSPPEQAHGPSRPHVGRTIRGLDGDYLKNVCVLHRQERQQVWIAATESTGAATSPSDRNDIVLVYSYRQRKWTKYRFPYIDIMTEVEASGDRRRPVGVVAGFVCQLDVTTVDVDSWDSGFTSVPTPATVTTVTNGFRLTLTSSATADSAWRFRPVWIGASGEYYLHLILDNWQSGGQDVIRVLPIDGEAVMGGDVETVYIGSRCPSVDFNFRPIGLETIKRVRRVALASTEGGMSTLELNVWWDNFDQEPSQSGVDLNQSITTAIARQYVALPVNGSCRMATFQLVAPNGEINLATFSVEYERHRGRAQQLR